MPATLFIWVTSIESAGTAPRPMRLQFHDRRELRISFARPGESCGPRARTEVRKVEVVAVSKTIGAAVEDFAVLATRPHLRIDSQASGCIGIPQRGGGTAR